MLNMSPEQMFAQVKTICSYCDTYEIYVNLILKPAVSILKPLHAKWIWECDNHLTF